MLALASVLVSSVEAADSVTLTIVKSSGFCPDGVWGLTKWPGGTRPSGISTMGSFCVKQNDDVGRAESADFLAPSAINLYLAGYPGLPGRRLMLKNVQTGEEKELKPKSRPMEVWQYNSLPVPPEWIGKRVRLVAEDQATGLGGWLGFSLPVLPVSAFFLPIDTHGPQTGFCPGGAYGFTEWLNGGRPLGLHTWGSYCKTGNTDVGWAASPPFKAGSDLSIYIAGYPDIPGLALAVEDIQTGRQFALRVPTPPEETWQLRDFHLPAEWKGRSVRVIAGDQSTVPGGWLAFSEPVHGHWMDDALNTVKTYGLVVLLLAVVLISLSQGPSQRWVVLTLIWGLTATAVLPLVFQWATPPHYTGSDQYLPITLGWLAAVAIGYRIFREEVRQLSLSQTISLVFVLFLLTSIVNNIHGVSVDKAKMFAEPNLVWQYNLHREVLQLSARVLPHSYRFLPNLIVRWMELAHLDFDAARDLYRLLAGLLLFYALYKYARLYSNYTGAMIAMLCTAVIYPISFEHYAGQLTDPLSHLSFVLALIFLETEEFALLLTTLVIGSLAKETVLAMAGYYILFCRKEKRYPLKAATICLVSVGVYLGVRLFVLHGSMQYQQASGVTLEHVRENWQDLNWRIPFLLTVCALLPFLALDWKRTPPSLRRQALYLLPVLFISSLFFSWLREARNFMPLVFVLAVVAGRYLSRQSTDTPEGASEDTLQRSETEIVAGDRLKPALLQ